jgi:hypothetical protein
MCLRTARSGRVRGSERNSRANRQLSSRMRPRYPISVQLGHFNPRVTPCPTGLVPKYGTAARIRRRRACCRVDGPRNQEPRSRWSPAVAAKGRGQNRTLFHRDKLIAILREQFPDIAFPA